MTTIRDEAHKKELVVRLKRIEGQLRGIQAMIDSGDDCESVIQQMSAARHALDKAFFNVLACAIQATPEKGVARDRVEHVAALLARFG